VRVKPVACERCGGHRTTLQRHFRQLPGSRRQPDGAERSSGGADGPRRLAHRQGCRRPANLTPLFLPPYSPKTERDRAGSTTTVTLRSGRPDQDDSAEIPRPCELAHSWVAAAMAIVLRSVPAATHRRERGGPACGAARPAPWTPDAKGAVERTCSPGGAAGFA
jgi:hypothetical protein